MAEAKMRSPRYPTIGLREALDKVRFVYDADHRNKIPKALVAQHMGYNGLNGKSLGVISAVSKYGLLDGGRDSMWVTERAQDILVRELGDPERVRAIREAASGPEIYQEITDTFPGGASDAAIRAHLVTKRDFLREAAERLIQSYRETMEVVAQESTAYDSPPAREDLVTMEPVSQGKALQLSPPAHAHHQVDRSYNVLTIDNGERELITGLLSKGSSFRLIVSGKIGVKEVERLIKKLELDKEILADADEDDEDGAFG
ncbi:hypothetical protein JYU29_00680 [Tianweitania sp. BSSL-BM11]|uniref:DUF3102 domain-containing protein n=1 Tax=Tianweitania aestuarii TaxID=2814886 RepID=A0ABS5RQF9_9HYPH|nr:hypothetical protein [Tianweitania aestuarii]MBS9719197.1 hypothetical protein [Tianweitania aestuarii]